jgi:hypothetical protein
LALALRVIFEERRMVPKRKGSGGQSMPLLEAKVSTK